MPAIAQALGPYDVAIVGGGIVGLATARAIQRAVPGATVAVLEKEPAVGLHQSGRNSGVVHSGVLSPLGSAKASFARRGAAALERYCAERSLPYQRVGKVIVATAEGDLGRLRVLHERAVQLQIAGAALLTEAELAAREPAVRGLAALLLPEVAIVDYAAIARALADDVRRDGGEVLCGARVRHVTRGGWFWFVETDAGDAAARVLVGCAGLHADRLARSAGADVAARIVPFRGEYWRLRGTRSGCAPIHGCVYPVPDPALPFLGVHLTPTLEGVIRVGPNAVLALGREAYRRRDASLYDALDTLLWPGFWRLAARHAGAGMREEWRSLSRAALVEALRPLLPWVEAADLERDAGAGIRAQAVDRAGWFVDDFRIVEEDAAVHVLNAPSPAATACLEVGRWVARAAVRQLTEATAGTRFPHELAQMPPE